MSVKVSRSTSDLPLGFVFPVPKPAFSESDLSGMVSQIHQIQKCSTGDGPYNHVANLSNQTPFFNRQSRRMSCGSLNRAPQVSDFTMAPQVSDVTAAIRKIFGESPRIAALSSSLNGRMGTGDRIDQVLAFREPHSDVSQEEHQSSTVIDRHPDLEPNAHLARQ